MKTLVETQTPPRATFVSLLPSEVVVANLAFEKERLAAAESFEPFSVNQ
jgi:hypothetical protein